MTSQHLSIVGKTHPGNRDHNEDCFAVDASIGLALVADGMGGHACGEVASDIVRQTLVEAVSSQQGLTEAIGRAHSAIKELAIKEPDKKGMGSTVVALRAWASDYEIAWVGDSRAYLWDGQLKQLTCDHSYVETLLSSGAISVDEVSSHPNKNLITQAVGSPGVEGLEIGLIGGRLAKGQKILLCSDGLIDELSDVQINEALATASSDQQLVEDLVSAAVNAGGRDNITVVLVTALLGDEESSHPKPVAITGSEGETVRQTTGGDSQQRFAKAEDKNNTLQQVKTPLIWVLIILFTLILLYGLNASG